VDVRPREVVPQTLAEGVHGRFRRRVHGLARRRQLGGERGDVDDRAAALAQHVGDGRHRGPHAREEVHPHHVLRLVGGHVVELLVLGNGRVGHREARRARAPLRRRGSLITVREMRDQMTALALGLLIGAAGVVGRATAIEPGTTVDQSNVDQVKDLLPPEVYAHFKKGEYANKLFDFPNSRWSWDDGFAEATKWNAEHLVLDEHKSPIDKDTKKRPDYIRGL